MGRWTTGYSTHGRTILHPFGIYDTTAKQVTDAHNADCDVYEASIAELEAKIIPADHPALFTIHAQELRIIELETELARVKSESLRVVADGKQYCVWCGGNGSWLEAKYEIGGTCVGQVENTCIHCHGYGKPVRLERWKDE